MKALIEHNFFKKNIKKSLSISTHQTLYQNECKIPAHIKKEASDLFLQAYTYSPSQNEPKTFKSFTLGKMWFTLLKISKNQEDIQTLCADPKSPAYTFDSSSCQYLAPKMLYTIPQAIWDKFIAQLEDQKIVKLLDLNTQRHLWAAYDICMNVNLPQLRYGLATKIGRFHFILKSPFISEELKNLNRPFFSNKCEEMHFVLHDRVFLKKNAHCLLEWQVLFLAKLDSVVTKNKFC